MLHYLRMAEKMVLLLGDIAHEGVTSALSTSGISYKWKFLNSSVENWKSIIRIFQKHDVKMVIGKLTGGVYSKEFRRLQLDLKHAREEKILSIRHRLESELVDVVQSTQQGLIESTVNALIPEVAGSRMSQAMLLPFSKPTTPGQQNITVNFKPQFIEHIEGVVAQEVNGIAQLTNNDTALISLFEQHGGSKATELTSALQELNDDSAPEPGRVTAVQRIKQFLIATTDKIGNAAAGVLQTYVEKKLLGS
jgi:hypothetical protein